MLNRLLNRKIEDLTRMISKNNDYEYKIDIGTSQSENGHRVITRYIFKRLKHK